MVFRTGSRANAQTPPSITSLSPPKAAPGDVVTITGTNFGKPQPNGTPQPTSTVMFGTAPVTDVLSWSDTSITVTVPNVISDVIPGSTKVKVSVPSGTASADFTATVPVIPIAVSLPPIQPVNGKLPTGPQPLTVAEKKCDAKSGIDLTQGNVPYSLTIDGGGFLTLSSQSPPGRCCDRSGPRNRP